VELITLASEARGGEERLGCAEIDVRRFEDESDRLRGRCCGLHGEAEVGKGLICAIAAHAKIAGEQCAGGSGCLETGGDGWRPAGGVQSTHVRGQGRAGRRGAGCRA